MKKFQGILAVVVLFCLLSVVAGPRFAECSGLRYSITVSKFENRSGWRGQWDLGHAWGAVLTDALNQTGRFIVLGEKDMRNEALREQDLAASGRTAGGRNVVVTGQMTPAQLLVKVNHPFRGWNRWRWREYWDPRCEDRRKGGQSRDQCCYVYCRFHHRTSDGI